jgi:hypothetical protein
MQKLRALKKFALSDGGLPLVWLGLTVLTLVPVWSQRLLPMLDTPNHLALIRGWHSFHDPEYKIAEYYTLRLRAVPYIFFYSAVHYLMYFFQIETANKLFLSAYLILFPLSVLALAVALNRSRWVALGSFPICFNPSWIYGYSSLLIGNCFGFFSLAALIAYLRRGRQTYLLLILIFCTLTYFSHILPWFVFGLGAICLLVLHRRDWRLGIRAAGAMLPSVLFALTAIIEESSDHAYMKEDVKLKVSWRDVPTLAWELPRRILGIFPGKLDMVVLFVLVTTVIGLCIWKGTREQGENDTERKELPLLLWMLGLLYLSLPYQIYGPLIFFQMAQRIPAMAMCLFLLLPGGRLIGREKLAMIPAILAAAVLPLKLAANYRDFSRRNMPFMRLIAEVPLGSNVMVVVRGMMNVKTDVAEKSGDPVTSGPVYWHFPSWPMALRGGYSPYLFDQGIPIRPIKTLKSPGWNAADTFDIRQAPEFDYYLIRNVPERFDREPALSLVDRNKDWTLYRRLYRVTDEP